MAKSRKLAYYEGSGHSGQNGLKGRVGPPESVKRAGKHGKARKSRKSGFLRVQGPLATLCPRARNRSEARAHSVPGPSLRMRGSEGSWSPLNVIGHLAVPSVVRAFPGPSPMRGNRGSWSPGYVVGACTAPQCSWASQPRNRGRQQAAYPATYAWSPRASSGTLMDSSAQAWRPAPLCALLERHGTASRAYKPARPCRCVSFLRSCPSRASTGRTGARASTDPATYA